MRKSRPVMRLTADHVALLAPLVPPDGPVPPNELATDEDIRGFVRDDLLPVVRRAGGLNLDHRRPFRFGDERV